MIIHIDLLVENDKVAEPGTPVSGLDLMIQVEDILDKAGIRYTLAGWDLVSGDAE